MPPASCSGEERGPQRSKGLWGTLQTGSRRCRPDPFSGAVPTTADSEKPSLSSGSVKKSHCEHTRVARHVRTLCTESPHASCSSQSLEPCLRAQSGKQCLLSAPACQAKRWPLRPLTCPSPRLVLCFMGERTEARRGEAATPWCCDPTSERRSRSDPRPPTACLERRGLWTDFHGSPQM